MLGRWLLACAVAFTQADAAVAQSLFVTQGERAAEGSIGWSVGPFSHGIELAGSMSLDGRWDVGFGLNRYSLELGGPDDGTLTEWTTFARYFVFKESDDGAPVSLAAHAQLFRDDFDNDDDGWWALGGGQLFKTLTLAEGVALHPYVGFSLTAERFTIGGQVDRSVYLTRQFGVHGQLALGPDTWVRISVEEQSFRRETFRAIRAFYTRRF